MGAVRATDVGSARSDSHFLRGDNMILLKRCYALYLNFVARGKFSNRF